MKILPVLLILGSCAASMVQDPNKTPAYAPKGYRQKGIVKYLNHGADSIIETRRESAFKQMYESCGGEYEITHEAPASSGYWTAANMYGGHNVYSSQYILIEFQCANTQKAAEI